MPHTTPQTVIVADADHDCANAVAMLLGEAGMAAKVAYGGRDAIALADTFQPVCAVIELAMPEVSGLDVARHLRMRYRGDVRIIGYTSWTGAEDRHRAAEAGFDQIVAKDADPFDLLGALSAGTYAVVMRSLDASRRQIHLQLKLAAALLDQAWLMPEIRIATKTCGFVARTLDAVDASLARLPLGPDERAELAKSVAGLRGRLPPANLAW